jgi:hypothetical protein
LKFFEVFKNLFPLSRAFELFVNNSKRKLIKGLSFLAEDIRREAELVYFDLFPDTTRFPEKWEKTFAVLFTSGELVKRRNILESLWKINSGGQSAVFLQEILQGISESILIIENVPVCDPRSTLSVRVAVCGNKVMRCGNRLARCNAHLSNGAFIPSMLRNDIIEFYSLPDDRRYWAFCFYVCRNVYRNGNNEILHVEKIRLNIIWKNYVEYLILKTKPVHSTAIIFIEWIEGEGDD